MRDYLQYFSDYAWRCFPRIDFVCGGVLAIVYFFVADHIGLTNYKTSVVAFIIAFSILEASYGVYRQERIMRAERERNVRVTAKLDSLSQNIPDPGPDKASLSVHVLWEVWVTQDVSTDKLALNLIYVYEKRWWQFWKKTRFPQVGIPPKGQGTTQYRKTYNRNQYQPNHDEATFEYVGDRRKGAEPHWILELVLKTGLPVGEHRIPVFIDWAEIRSRGTNPPL